MAATFATAALCDEGDGHGAEAGEQPAEAGDGTGGDGDQPGDERGNRDEMKERFDRST